MIPDRIAEDRRERQVDIGLTALLVLQGVTLFAIIPLGGGLSGRLALDISHVCYALVSVAVLTQNRPLRVLLCATIGLLIGWPLIGTAAIAALHLDPTQQHEIIAATAFAFNAAVTMLVARHVFAARRVTVHRIRGAILVYLNLAALFALAYGAIQAHVAAAFGGSLFPLHPRDATAAFTYFSLSTITTTGYGDVVPMIPLTRSLANLESVVGQLFPATLLARLVALHLAHESRRDGEPRA